MAGICNYIQVKHCNKAVRLFSTKVSSNLKAPTQADLIGPPDPVSNLRPIIFARSKNESNLEKKYREAREDTQLWNEHFWKKHNTSFIQERKQFQKDLKAQGKESITADDMSVFYKEFLDKNWQTHLNYNIAWYKRNLKLLFLEIRVRLTKLKFK
ncbi:cytochrome c oxidase assembly factor 8 [Osmia lignaria lignaria]|uniref:cytochrome c oxidase assembly factor 8 n=1 Tax=Osmia lignaria lignaria TaxID=1437193 RepID=UPI00147904BB|nr:cytochrome c oxidase assembly factor 8 [Osmia lignaria]